MALVFCDSFSHYDVADILKKWTDQAASVSVALLQGAEPAGRMAVRLVAGAGNNAYLGKTLSTTLETFIAGVWFRASTFATASPIMVFLDGATEHVSVRYNTSGNLTFTRNGTVLATSSSVMSVDTWYHIEVKVTIGDAGDSPSGRYEVRVNGTATGWIADSGTGQDTRNGGNKSISAVRIHGRAANNGLEHRHAGFYILNTSGSVANDFVGVSRIAVAVPIAAGNHQDWTPNHADNFVNVSELWMDGDTTFNQSDTAGDVDTHEFSKIPGGTVHAVQHVITARQDSGSGRTIRSVTRIGSTDYNGTTVATGATHQMFLEPASVSPATAAQWTASEINGAEFGYERVS